MYFCALRHIFWRLPRFISSRASSKSVRIAGILEPAHGPLADVLRVVVSH
jgi:hypothetical protein